MHTHFRWLALREVQVGAAVFDDYAEKLIQVSHDSNDKIRMPNDEAMPKSEGQNLRGPVRFKRVSTFELRGVSSFVIRGSSFSQLLSHHLFLLGARVSLLRADQAALTQFDQGIIH
jgi:hypothetical protein